MKWKYLISLTAALFMLSSCGENAPANAPTAETEAVTTSAETAVTEAEPVTGVQKLTAENSLALGRTYDNAEGRWCALSGSGAAFTVTGTYCKINLLGDTTALVGKPSSKVRVAVYLDGERVLDEMVDRKEKELTVFEGTEERTAEVRIVKLSESANSVYGIASVDTDGAIAPAEEKPLKIEFIGDSITCGYGVDDPEHMKPFSTETEDCTKTYAYKTAQNLNADCSLVCYSGYGIISGFSDGKTQQKSQLVPNYYDKLGFSYTSFGVGDMKAADIEWDHKNFEPDIIVINLGTNDASWTTHKDEREEEFVALYKEFLGHLREVHPKSYIICTLGIMGADLYPYIELAAYEYTNESGDDKVLCMQFDVQDVAADGYASDWHPTEATHTKAADKLTEFIKEKIEIGN